MFAGPRELRMSVGGLFQLLLPPVCPGCGQDGPGSILLCRVCRQHIEQLPRGRCICCALPFSAAPGAHRCGDCLKSPPAFDRVFAAGLYRGLLRDLIHRFKYQGDAELDMLLGRMLRKSIGRQGPWDLLVAVPLCRSRLRQRGYNQARLLGKVLSKALEVELAAPGALTRVRDTRPLEGLGAPERRQVLKGAFVAGPQVRGRRILLVDDVMTSGATVREICTLLGDAGASAVSVAVVARTPRHDVFPVEPAGAISPFPIS